MLLGTNTLTLDLSFFIPSLQLEGETTKSEFFKVIKQIDKTKHFANLYELYKFSFTEFKKYEQRLENFVKSKGLAQANVFPEPTTFEFNLFNFIDIFNYAVKSEIEPAFSKVKHDHESTLALVYFQGNLAIAYKNKKGELTTTKNPVFVDFLNGEVAKRAENINNLRSEIVVRATLSKRLPVTQQYILDATAGFGQDSFLLVSAGASVLMFERNPVIGILLADGLRRLQEGYAHPVPLNLRFPVSITSKAGKSICKDLNFTSVYLDPMYPHKNSTAKVNKNMQTIQEIVGLDADTNELFNSARSLKAARIVVKRPKNAPFLGEVETLDAVKSPSHRFDLYYLGKDNLFVKNTLNGYVGKDLLESLNNLRVIPEQNNVTYENLINCRKFVNYVNLQQESFFAEKGKYHSVVCAYSRLLHTDTLVARAIDFDTYKQYRDRMISDLNFEVPGDSEYRLKTFLYCPELAEKASLALAELNKEKSKSKKDNSKKSKAKNKK
ncbi:class I SAM-dependent methyltransferase [Psittacicella gerlachiana]|uniref:class I SAM-dependent methyltransferase n=1 Tax=Psittacicella gerlachiana TaxID=2028574 RepID=UPI001CA667F1|nr:class I SAM-dependent methyltransferase [Psittacicella gerlachiana]